MFDTRAPMYAVSNFVGTGSAPRVMIKWSPGAGTLLAASSADTLHIWDSRMHNACIEEIPAPGGIVQFAWDDSYVAAEAADNSILICNRRGNVDWHNSLNFQCETSVQSPYPINDDTLLFSIGRRTVVCCGLNQKQPQSSSAFLVGCPRQKYDLGSVFSKTSTLHSPGIEIADTHETVVGMCLGEPGRLVPPAQGGLELVLASASSCLHAIKIPASVLADCRQTETVPTKAKPRNSVNFQSQEDSERSRQPGNEPGNVRDIRVLYRICPKYSVSLLRESNVTDIEGNKLGSSNSVSIGVREFWKHLQQDILILQTLIQRDEMGITVDGIDQNARQITLGMKRLELDAAEESNMPHHKKIINDVEFSLIISFPTKYPLTGSPSFTIRPLSSSTSKAPADIHKFVAEVTAELNNLVRNSNTALFQANADDSFGFIGNLLWKIASCFRDRVVQLRCADSTSMGEDLVASGNSSIHTSSTQMVSLSDQFTLSIGDDTPLQKQHMVEATVIDPRAYQVPCPRSSGAIFTNNGTLLCYGGTRLNFDVTSSEKTDTAKQEDFVITLVPTSSTSNKTPGKLHDAQNLVEDFVENSFLEIYPRTYADMLLRMKEETLPESHAGIGSNEDVIVSNYRDGDSADSMKYDNYNCQDSGDEEDNDYKYVSGEQFNQSAC
jgi:hypothetical protein